MQPGIWSPPVPLAPAEPAMLNRIKRAKLFVFLPRERHTLFDAPCQPHLAALDTAAPQGQPPIPPAQLALATSLQAYTGISDDDLIECLTMARRWQLVLDCLDAAAPPFTKPPLIAFRQRLIAAQADRRLLERTLERASATTAMGTRSLRAARDSSPLWGAGGVEDPYNLVGHALHQAVRVLARQQGRGLADTAPAAGIRWALERWLKAALDLDWDAPHASQVALTTVRAALSALDRSLAPQLAVVADAPAVRVALTTAAQVHPQDVPMTATGQPTLLQGVAPDRRISLSDAQRRHGRKSRPPLSDGYKRQVRHDLDTGRVRAVGITPANAPNAPVTDALWLDLAQQDAALTERHIDRAYLSSRWVTARDNGLAIYCTAWPVRTGRYFAKTAFRLHWDTQTIRCPDGVELPVQPDAGGRFPAARGATCATAWPLYQQQNRTECADPSRCAVVGGVARPPTAPGGAGEGARPRGRRARTGPYWPLAGRPRPLPGRTQAPV